MTMHNSGRASGTGRMRDLGAFVTVALARPLHWLLNRNQQPGAHKWTDAEIRRLARDYPDDGLDVASATMVRTISWAALMVTNLAVVLVLIAARGFLGATPMVAFIAITMFCGGMVIASSFRWSLAWAVNERLDRRLAGTTREQLPGGCLMWMTAPSHLDIVFALLWSALLTPALAP